MSQLFAAKPCESVAMGRTQGFSPPRIDRIPERQKFFEARVHALTHFFDTLGIDESACHAKLLKNLTLVCPIGALTLATHTAIRDPLSRTRLEGFWAKADPLVRRIITAICHRATRRIQTALAVPGLYSFHHRGKYFGYLSCAHRVLHLEHYPLIATIQLRIV